MNWPSFNFIAGVIFGELITAWGIWYKLNMQLTATMIGVTIVGVVAFVISLLIARTEK